ncbi:MAG: uroporphyrinogen decarboxylase [Acidobacteriales bacterium]|nr:uroporphyrinogen decarboxylase [Terriglobales bacterium]
MSAPESRFVKACRALPVDRTPVWFMRQAGRYMAQYRAVRKQHSLIEICKNPILAADVTITAAEALGVDAAIIFADLLLPLEVMGVPFHFSGEGPVIDRPVRTQADIEGLRTDCAADLGYVSEAVSLVCKHFGPRLPVIGFCGAPYTLASYMIEGGSSRHYIQTKSMMYSSPAAWNDLMRKLVAVVSEYALEQVKAGADAIQIFDSWVGCLGVEDYRSYVLPHAIELVRAVQQGGVPVIYFGTDTATLLPAIQQTGAEVIGLDWRIPLHEGWSRLGFKGAVQGNLDPVILFSGWKNIRLRAEEILKFAAGRPGHIFNLGHGILPETPFADVKALTEFVQQSSAKGHSRGE